MFHAEVPNFNSTVIPFNQECLDEVDEKSFKSLFSIQSEMCLYTSAGHSVFLRDFYANCSAFVILSGPSLKQCDLSLLQGRRGIMTMGVNNSWTVFKPNLWISVDDPGNFHDIGWKDPSIMKFAPIGHHHKVLVIKQEDGTFRPSQFKVREMPSTYYFRRNSMFNPQTFLSENTVNWGCEDKTIDTIGCKGSRSVMLAAIKMLYYLGFRTIYLLGADFHMKEDDQNYAFKQDRSPSSVKGNNYTYKVLNKRFDAMKDIFAHNRLKVFNCYKDSGLKSFPYISYENAIERASTRFMKPIDTEGWYDRKANEKKDKETKNIIVHGLEGDEVEEDSVN